MVCPVRHGVKFDYLQDGDKYIVTNQEEYFPECYEGDCPYWDYTGCQLIDKDLEAEG